VSTDESVPTTAELLARIEELTRRVEWLEADRPGGPPQPTAIAPDVVLAISAAVAGYLGERARVRQIRLSGTPNWTQQGRSTVMGSHNVTRGRSHALR
jgi:methylmalonyl-CoA carboxyltransferase large subunit